MMGSEKESNKEGEEVVVKEGGEVREKWDIPAEHLREADLIRWGDLSFGERIVYFLSAFNFSQRGTISFWLLREFIW